MEIICFNNQWTYYKEGRETSQILDLPHDAMIEERRSSDNPGGGAVAFFQGGIYVYEKNFSVPISWQEKCITFEFEGIYKNSKVYINGQEAGGRPYGYIGFYVNADNFLKYGEENTIRVVADNAELPNSRWYSGSGIYRPVNLIIQNKTHIDIEGVKISTLAYSPAKILVETASNGGEIAVAISYDGKIIATGNSSSIELDIPNAKLWSDQAPNLYQCHVTLTENDTIVDEVTVDFGIRLVKWCNKGLYINGVETLLRGGCVHHDNGILGARSYAKSEARRVKIMKDAGYNAIRSSHNPASKAMIDACDRLGMYLIDETWDTWYGHKNKYDYANDFNDWYQADIKSLVDRDFNHPSVIMYSIGNEVSEPYQARGVALTKEITEYFHSLDQNRAVTGGINLMIINLASKGRGIYKEENVEAAANKDTKKDSKKKEKANGSAFFNIMASMIGTGMNKMANSKAADRVTSPCLDALDIAGYNYASGRYKLEGKSHPERVLFGSETFPQDIAKNWAMVKRYPYLVGDFMWTAWDYLGEVGIGGWSYNKEDGGAYKPYPWLLADCGAIDILGNVGIEADFAATVWGLRDVPTIGVRPVNHPGEHYTKSIWRGTNAIKSWAWQGCEGNLAEIEVYVDADTVELLLDGKSCGKKKVKAYKTMFKQKYTHGTLTAVAYDANGKETGRSILESADANLRLRVTPEDTTVPSGEIVYIDIDIVGENGVVESNADTKLRVTVSGGELLAFGSANPRSEESYNDGSYTTYYGHAQAVVKAADSATNPAGKITITVSGNKLETETTTIYVEKESR
ncbi:MAG: DUF4982 domain-containing protein [Clostridiales Family XIII bacterium]|jgi:hypothetical protein|nr:DUF4982 domain-containing protein [Clostridiales Family XIII bacterium]